MDFQTEKILKVKNLASKTNTRMQTIHAHELKCVEVAFIPFQTLHFQGLKPPS